MFQPCHTLVQLCQVMLMISFSSSITLLASQLHPGEVAALREIGKTIDEDGQISLKFSHSCESERLNITVPDRPNAEMNDTIQCDCNLSNDSYCHITAFHLKGFSLPGRLPSQLANLTYVKSIDLTRNYLYGTIPVEWASMKNLTYLSLIANRLSGNIPGHLGSFTTLKFLSLEANQFNGTIPPQIGNLVNLKTLILSSNQLQGSLPETLSQIKGMEDFRASDNNLDGTIPEFVGRWTQIRRLEFYATGLEGPIPTAIFGLENLVDLRITDLPGPEFQLHRVPKKNMENLVLRNVNLTGVIPQHAWEVETTLDLSFNKLVGGIPSRTKERRFTFLSGNMLSGTVQDLFLQNSKNLDVSYNNFSWSSNCNDNGKINRFRSSSIKNNLSGLLPCSGISQCRKNYRSFHINCGGPDVKSGRILYEGDIKADSNAASMSYYREGSNWGFSSTGEFMNDHGVNDNTYTPRLSSHYSTDDSGLYTTARRTPLSLTYYGYCLENGNYTVRLHFAEIEFTDEELYNKVARRVFDIYIQEPL